jgi:hypothetical protein
VTWWPSSATERLALVDEAAERARDVGDVPGEATAEVLRAAVLGELGRIPEMWTAMATARRGATPLRLSYLLLVLDAMEAPWLAMSGRFDEADQVLQRLLGLYEQTALAQAADGVAGALVTVRLYQGRLAEVIPMMDDLLGASRLPVAPVVAALLLRLGLVEEARALVPGIDVDEPEFWFSSLVWCAAGEVALGLGDATLGAAAYARAAPFAGGLCLGGTGAPLGPVDAFLALAAAATGETATATRHADRALVQCAEWAIPPVAQWLRDQRDRYGF